ncbi:DinB family protein [Candidatus Latescibacterota bacterium]
MNWTELLKSKIEYTYGITDGLLDLVEDDTLDWKPSTGNNWMTTGQLLMHICIACGAPIRGYVIGDWGLPEGINIDDLSPEEMGLPEGINIDDLSPEEMLPPAEKLPTLGSVTEAKEFLAEDKQLALDMLAKCDEDKLANETASAPWDQTEIILGYRFLQMVAHLSLHKSQLFYYLKLQGKPVNTSHLCGS